MEQAKNKVKYENNKVSIQEIEEEMRKELTPTERKVLKWFKQKKNAKTILQKDSQRKVIK